jgi:glycosyltransferase involved in cell wall biosynthesis
MRLDVVLPTYNRSHLLDLALRSLEAATRPPGIELNVYVADNNSTDDTAVVLQRWVDRSGGWVHRIHARDQGRGAALNAGIRAGDGDIVAMIDDDETVARDWLLAIVRAFEDDPTLDFVGGPYLAEPGLVLPEWIPPGYPAVIGVIPGSNREQTFGHDYDGMLMGGNAAIRRRVLDEVGLYDPALGRSKARLLSGEDDDMYRRLLAAGARGRFLPHMIIHHHVPPERLTRRYYRRWCFGHGVSMGQLDRRSPVAAVYLGGVPRYLVGEAVRGFAANVVGVLRGSPDRARRFANELKTWSLLGFAYGKHVHGRRVARGLAAPAHPVLTDRADAPAVTAGASRSARASSRSSESTSGS